MTIKEQIIRTIFEGENPSDLSHIKDTYTKFKYLASWQDFAGILREYNFKNIPQQFSRLSKRKKAK
jgi:hypothetical protein